MRWQSLLELGAHEHPYRILLTCRAVQGTRPVGAGRRHFLAAGPAVRGSRPNGAAARPGSGPREW